METELFTHTWFFPSTPAISPYYGAYPEGYIERVLGWFGQPPSVAHVFAGGLNATTKIRGDVIGLDDGSPPDVVCDAENLMSLEGAKYDLVLADPPYSQDDAEHYGRPMVDRKKVLIGIAHILKPGGWCAWLDQGWPLLDKRILKTKGFITLVFSTNRRFRILVCYQKPTEALA